MDKSKKIIIALSLALAISLFFNFSQNRYYISTQNSDFSYKVDRWTGKVWVLYFNEKLEVEEVEDVSDFYN